MTKNNEDVTARLKARSFKSELDAGLKARFSTARNTNS